jgi:hypothetical protein
VQYLLLAWNNSQPIEHSLVCLYNICSLTLVCHYELNLLQSVRFDSRSGHVRFVVGKVARWWIYSE